LRATGRALVKEGIAEHDQASGQVLLEHRYDPRMVAPVVSLVHGGGGGLPVLRFNHFDRPGAVVATSTVPALTVANQLSNGTLAGQYKYGAWGNSATLAGTASGYAGYRCDAESGLYYVRARYYDPRLGRFLSTDLLSQGPCVNVYAYVGNDPLNRGSTRAASASKMCVVKGSGAGAAYLAACALVAAGVCIQTCGSIINSAAASIFNSAPLFPPGIGPGHLLIPRC
jgi:RHS repeat-associated protein